MFCCLFLHSINQINAKRIYGSSTKENELYIFSEFEEIIQRPQIEKTTNVLLPWKFVIALKINYAKVNMLFYPNSFLAK